mgnify:CR=1 FL=1
MKLKNEIREALLKGQEVPFYEDDADTAYDRWREEQNYGGLL